MLDFNNFDEVFDFAPDSDYDEETVRAILANKKVLGVLFIERVMKILGIKRPQKYYPPKSNSELRSLHTAIVESQAADQTKLSVIYYLLLEFDPIANQGLASRSGKGTPETSASLFAQRTYLPQKYAIYMDGLWHLDHQEYEDALKSLTFPPITESFPDDVLSVLAHRCSDISLPLAYYHTVQPHLKTQDSIDLLFIALTKASVTEAFYFARSQPEYTYRSLFELLIQVTLESQVPTTTSSPDPSVELVNLPFSKQEEQWMEEYIMTGEGKSLKRGKDFIMMRKIGMGDFTGALDIKGVPKRSPDGNLAGNLAGLNWEVLSGAIEEGLGPRLDVL